MKQTTLLQGAVMAILALILGIANSSGPASNQNYYTGGPSTGGGTELTCTICHNSGRVDFGEPQINWTVAASEAGPNQTTYMPGETYYITVNVTAPMGSPAGYGFSSTFLAGGTNEGTDEKAGTPFSADVNTRFTNVNNVRTYVEHRNRTPSGTWNFRWIAPTDGTGEVKIYSVGNAVNGANGTGGDSGSTMSTIITLTEAALPVELTNFEVVANKNTVRLDWSTAAEDNVSHFEIERSEDGRTFSPVGQLSASGNTQQIQHYSFTNPDAPAGNLYYRLRIVDQDEAFAFGPVTQVLVNADNELLVYPNPATERVFVSSNAAETADVRLIDLRGRTLLKRKGTGELNLASLRPGIYLIETVRSGVRNVRKLIKR